MPKFAVDSADPVTEQLWNQVVAAAGAPPRVWFRYLSGIYGVGKDEIAFLHSKGCAVGLIYDLATAQSVAGGYAAGQSDARATIAAMQALGAPFSMCPFIDVEAGWRVDPGWVCGVGDTFRASPFWKAGALYCNPGDGNVDSFAVPFAAAKAMNANVGLMVFWSSEPEPGEFKATAMPAWAPATCSGQRVVVWQAAENCYGGVVDLDEVADDAMDLFWQPPQVGNVAGFTDVAPGAWYAAAVERVAGLGLMTGESSTLFNPDGQVTRAQLAVTLARVADKAGWK